MPERDEVKADAEETLARSAIYRALALGLSYPGPEVLEFFHRGFARKLLDAVSLLPGDSQAEFTRALEGLKESVGGLEDIGGEYSRLFGTRLACTPYETEYDPMGSVRKGHELADLLGFYHAFGFAPSEKGRELPDHIGAELEFMSLLLLKEAYAGLNGWGDKVEICAEAELKFLREHLGGWVFAFCDRLEGASGVEFYRSLARLLRTFMEQEVKRRGVEPMKQEGGPSPLECDAFTCPFAGPGPN